MTTPNPFTPELLKQASTFLQHCKTASIATVDAQNQPHAANIQYVSDDQWRIYFVSSPTATHSQNIAASTNVALTIYDCADDFRKIHGLQIRGHCQIVEQGQPWRHAWKLFAAKYPFVATVSAVRQRFETEHFYCITPTWIRWIDNRKSFGFKAEKQM